MRRRTLLQRGAVLTALGLAGCTGGGDDTPTETVPPETDTRTSTPTADEATTSPTASPTSSGSFDQVVTVGPGALTFEPASFEIPVGGTVQWVWESSGHNVRPSATPDGADWSGTDGGDGTTYSADFTYSYTFEVAGAYDYYCAPHRSAGMTGTFTVGE